MTTPVLSKVMMSSLRTGAVCALLSACATPISVRVDDETSDLGSVARFEHLVLLQPVFYAAREDADEVRALADYTRLPELAQECVDSGLSEAVSLASNQAVSDTTVDGLVSITVSNLRLTSEFYNSRRIWSQLLWLGTFFGSWYFHDVPVQLDADVEISILGLPSQDYVLEREVHVVANGTTSFIGRADGDLLTYGLSVLAPTIVVECSWFDCTRGREYVSLSSEHAQEMTTQAIAEVIRHLAVSSQR